jgi:hypothetical protein
MAKILAKWDIRPQPEGTFTAIREGGDASGRHFTANSLSEARQWAFKEQYTDELQIRIAKNPDKFVTPLNEAHILAAKMTRALAQGTANLDSNAIKATCRVFRIKPTMYHIRTWMNGR